MDDPIAFFLTWVTYGTWLPGDSRGWVEYKHGGQLPEPARVLEATAKMTEDACRLTQKHRCAVEGQFLETCQHRGWHLHAVNCRSNHVHVVVSAGNSRPKKVRADLKAWATVVSRSLMPLVTNWWAERGSIRWVFDEDGLEATVIYTLDRQEPEALARNHRKPEALAKET